MKNIFFFSFLTFSIQAYSQNLNSNFEEKRIEKDEKFSLSTSFMSIVDFKPFVDIGIEKMIKPNFSIEQRIGYYLNFNSISLVNNMSSEFFSGYRVRSTARYLLGNSNLYNFIGLELMYNYYKFDVSDWIFNGSYSELKNFQYINNAFGLSVLYGLRVPVLKNSRTFIEFFTGLGLKILNKRSDDTNINVPRSDLTFLNYNTIKTLPVFKFGLKVGLAFK